jgi:hypothetical protein
MGVRIDETGEMTDHRLSYIKTTILAFAAALAGVALAAGLWWGAPTHRMLTWLPALLLLGAAALMGAVGLGGLLALGADDRKCRSVGGANEREASVDGV